MNIHSFLKEGGRIFKEWILPYLTFLWTAIISLLLILSLIKIKTGENPTDKIFSPPKEKLTQVEFGNTTFDSESNSILTPNGMIKYTGFERAGGMYIHEQDDPVILIKYQFKPSDKRYKPNKLFSEFFKIKQGDVELKSALLNKNANPTLIEEANNAVLSYKKEGEDQEINCIAVFYIENPDEPIQVEFMGKAIQL